MNWLPNASLAQLHARAAMLKTIRDFFNQRQVLEVETPSLSQAAVTDVHLHCFKTQFVGRNISDKPLVDGAVALYLQTSPEFHMKRLLAAGSGCIYQISKVYRNEESGRFHNPEFSLLEWYRVDFDHHQLMDEMADLLKSLLKCETPVRCTYQAAFLAHLQVDPLTATVAQLKLAGAHLALGDVLDNETDKDTILQLLFCVAIESKIGQDVPYFVYDFPASQAALARINKQDPRVADRFEVYYKSVELANGFYELNSSAEQLKRFQADNQLRQQMGLAEMPIDQRFVTCLDHLPNCAGVALGLDRLLMLCSQQPHIDDVLSFNIDNA
ncbi:elongation factor P--(R)-beta-lysine ligase [Psychromonas sp. RZ22]|uniref:elongation factor P--(R)-beta-lysine ligase n=1 Tax=Psychromonas algarum TaxID=2555643 RepID=UPI00106853C7|nr:elongation factor P--(R)-beta-lysine ligase [Psychromonas sp. RZ22]TEW56796.1 elongation factor P--(R)-beta-lysine ligase [Psychromonas sp. RZ22]